MRNELAEGKRFPPATITRLVGPFGYAQALPVGQRPEGQAQRNGSGGWLQFELFGPQPDDIPHNPDQAPDTQEYGSQSKVATF